MTRVIHSRTILCRFTSLTMLYLLSSYGYQVYFMFLYTSCYSIIFILFLYTLARSHLRPWICMPKYKSCDCTLGGAGVLWRSSWATVGLFMIFYLFWLAVCSIIVLFLCYRYVVVLYIFMNVLMDSYVLCLWHCSVLCYVLLLHVIYNSSNVLALIWYLYMSTKGLMCIRRNHIPCACTLSIMSCTVILYFGQ